ncbi:hypothetical protein N2603_23330 [Bradyrhizobium huanghuaihaiense]|uniref:hypothetical protein n=1 Tax=Bradyrhizobium huanghuaihaiense TaxID=990078 RepID=UPI0021AA083C|nr:hypothetical protein [Bradyrhizobium sp. CB3035]UWU73039.1 hypothetical protein N2603_23330 [Bradyrhizobium sp. CB3035]
MTCIKAKAAFDAACAAQAARIRASEGLGPEVSVDLELTPEILALFEEYEAALAAEGKRSSLIVWTED